MSTPVMSIGLRKSSLSISVIEVMDARIPDIVLAAVDWQDVWDHNLRYDFNSILLLSRLLTVPSSFVTTDD
jgi:hypothetical protein